MSESLAQIGKVRVQRVKFEDVDSYMGAIQHLETAINLNSLKDIRNHIKHAKSLIGDISTFDMDIEESDALTDSYNYLALAKDLIDDYFESICDL